MAGFVYTEMDKGEQILIGPLTSTSSVSISGQTQPGQTGISTTSGRTVGVTNKRVIVEDMGNPKGVKFLPVDKVARVYLARKGSAAQPVFKLEKVEDASGSSLRLGIQGVTMEEITKAFPMAEVKAGGAGFPTWAKIVAVVVALVVLLLCFGPLLLAALTNRG